jgi:beta-glucosidase
VIVKSLLDSLLPRRCAATRSPRVESPPYRFPADFLWGAATAAYQIETTQDDDWAAFENEALAHRRFSRLAPGKALPGHIHRLGDYSEEIRRKKSDFDARIESDLGTAAAMGHNSYRFSIAWARLFPTADKTEPDRDAIAHYRRIFETLAAHGMTPVVTLFHFSSPAWLWQPQGGRRGFERADALLHWERFVRAVLQHFGDRMPIVCTLNEPLVYVYAGYLDGVFPPHERRSGPKAVLPVIEQLLAAHALAYRLIKEDAARRGISVAVGYAQHTRAFEPLRNGNPLDRLVARFVERAFIWDFCDAACSGVLRMTGTLYKKTIPGLRGTQDYLGVNYYGRFYVKATPLSNPQFEVLMHDPATRDADRVNDLDWASYPRGFRAVLNEAARRYRLPIYVLENGTADEADDDVLRRQLLVEHVHEMWLARRDGADVRGYFHWSLLDNFEWAEGFEPRFGLIKVDYRDGFTRTPRPSAALYTRIIRSGLDEAICREYGLV